MEAQDLMEGHLQADLGSLPVDIDVVKLTWRTSHDSSCPGAIDFASASLHTPTILSITLQLFKISISTTLRNVWHRITIPQSRPVLLLAWLTVSTYKCAKQWISSNILLKASCDDI